MRIKGFLNLIGYEALKVVRNKFIFVMSIIFSIVFLLSLTLVQSGTYSYPIAIYSDKVDYKDQDVMDFIESSLDVGDIVEVDSLEEGIQKIKDGEVCFLISIEVEGKNAKPTATFYYDPASIVSNYIANDILDDKNQYAYNYMVTFLKHYGITINESYFQYISTEKINHEITDEQSYFAVETACCVAIIIMLGIAYSIARDNETEIDKNLLYIPLGLNKYIFSKIIPFFNLGIFEFLIIVLFGKFGMGINFMTNWALVILLSLFFLISLITLSTLFSQLKSQLATVFAELLVILLPIFINFIVYIQACPMIIRIILYCFPMTPFVQFFSAMVFNGVVIWWYIPLFCCQAIIYYLLSYFIIKKKMRT